MSPMSNDELTIQEFEHMIGSDLRIHTFMQAGQVLVPAMWSREDVIEAAQAHGAYKSGPCASSMQHGAVVYIEIGRELEPVFVKTKNEI